ncbi:hypothetical protein GF377_10375, partial [candidate division GN15 bacterium]|nr:hypothetical protein [candidate division GN15 bacterium]
MADLTICVYEDNTITSFHPISHLRPVYSMRAGIVPLFKRVAWHFPGAPICLASRFDLSGLVAAEHRDYPVNIVQRGDNHAVLFVNGRLRDFGDLPKLVKDSRLT